MRCLLALLALTVASPMASAAVLTTTVDLAQSNVTTFDPTTFAAGPNVDVYHVRLFNPNAGDVTSIELSLSGSFENRNAGAALTFKEGTDLPTLGPNTVAETFFVLPPGSTANEVLSSGTIDDGTRLASAFTLPGTVAFVGNCSSSVLAVLSVPAGSTLDTSDFNGRVAIAGQFVEIGEANTGEIPICQHQCTPGSPNCPEPSTLCLALLSMAGILFRR